MSTADIIREYPDLEDEDIRQSLQYASAPANEEIGFFKEPCCVRFLAGMGVSLTTVGALRASIEPRKI